MVSKTSQSLAALLLVAVVNMAGVLSQPQRASCDSRVDLVIVLDASGSVAGQQGWWPSIFFAVDLVSALNIHPDGVRVGVVRFDAIATTEVYLGTYSDLNDLISKINNINEATYWGNTNIPAALRQVADVFQQGQNRPDVADIVIFVTDGDTKLEANNMDRDLKVLDNMNVTLISIGVTNSVSMETLKQIASKDEYVIQVDDFAGLGNALQNVLNDFCSVAEKPTPAPAPIGCPFGYGDLVFIVDSSGSIKDNQPPGVDNWKEIKLFIMNVIDSFEVGPNNLHVGVVMFGNGAEVVVPLTQTDRGEIFRLIQQMPHRMQNTNTAAGLRMASQELFIRDEVGDRTGATDLVVIITDGVPTMEVGNTPIEAQRLRDMGVGIFGVGITKSVNMTELSKWTDASWQVQGFTNLSNILRTVEAAMCQVQSDSCVVDLTIILDASGSIQWQAGSFWKLMKDFAKEFAAQFDIKPSQTRVALIKFSNEAVVVGYLDSYTTQKQVWEAIDSIQYDNGETNIVAAIRAMRTQIYSGKRGDRGKSVRRIGLVITDGKPTQGGSVYEEALIARTEEKIDMWSFGVTDNVNVEELKHITGVAEKAIIYSQFNKLSDSLDTVVAGCIKPEPPTEPPVSCRFDVTLIVDASGSIIWGGNANWQRTKEFYKQVLASFNVDQQETRVALVKFNDGAEVIFNLNKYDTLDELNKRIDGLVHDSPNGGTDITTALRVTRERIYESGARRQGVKGLVFLTTDGRDTATKKNIAEQAQLLRAANVDIYVIGVTNAIDNTQLNEIAGDPSKVFTVDQFDSLTTILDDIRVCDKPVPTLPPLPVSCRIDVTIVLDSSGSISYAGGWDHMTTFVINVLGGFNIAPDETRVALVTFSDRAKLIFGLEPFTEEDVFGRIMALDSPSGRTNIYDALTMTCRQIYGGSGDRLDAENVLILLTDGRASPGGNVTAIAEECRAKNIKLYAVGVTDHIDEQQLVNIVGKQHQHDRYFFVNEFKALNDVLDEIRVCKKSTPPPIQCDQNSDLAFVIDISGSIDEKNFHLMQEFVNNIVLSLNLESGDIRLAIISFSNQAKLELKLGSVTNRYKAVNITNDIRFNWGGQTNTHNAFRMLREQVFNGKGNDRPDTPNIAVVLTDGNSRVKSETFREARLAKLSGIHMITIALDDWYDEMEFKAISSYPHESNMIQVKNYYNLKDYHERVRDLICNNVDECETDPCMNGGECVDNLDVYTCFCKDGFGGDRCQRACEQKTDVVISIDASGSVTKQNFYDLITFVRNVTKDLPVGIAGTRLGVQIFNREPEIYFNLKDYEKKIQMLNAEMVPYYSGGDTDIEKALRDIRLRMFTEVSGDRPGVQNVLLMITDGKLGRGKNSQRVFEEAVQLREAGVKIIVLGYGPGARSDILELIASPPASNNVIILRSSNQLSRYLDEVRPNISGLICDDVDECLSNPCRNEGKCINMRGGFRCECPPSYTGLTCEKRCSGQVDLAFAIDVSGSIRKEQFPTIQKYIVDVVNKLEISSKKVRVAAITFSDQSRTVFQLNRYNTSHDIANALYLINYAGVGRTNIAAALDRVRDSVFKTENGGRPNVPDILVILTDGSANVETNSLIPKAMALKKNGVHIMTVSVGRSLNEVVLRAMASYPMDNNMYSVDSYSHLNRLVDNVVDSLCDDVNECDSNPCQHGGGCINSQSFYLCNCQLGYAGYDCEVPGCPFSMDVAFLVDVAGSTDKITHERMLMVSQGIVERLTISSIGARIALATFTDRASLVFNLNEYSTKYEVLINLMFGRKTGTSEPRQGFSLAQSQIFPNPQSSNNRGGNRASAPNYIITLTDGTRNIETNTARRAEDLKDNGNNEPTLVYMVAFGNEVDHEKMSQLGSGTEPPFYLRVQSDAHAYKAVDTIIGSMCGGLNRGPINPGPVDADRRTDADPAR